MNGRNAPLSPVSLGGSEWSGISKYQSVESGPGGGIGGGPYGRGQLISPPNSGGSNGAMNGFPGPKNVGGPSPPPSVGRTSSTGTNMYSRSDSMRTSSMRDPEKTEAILAEHYNVLKGFLTSTARDAKAISAANKAQDKLLRLSPTQFLELSTDVYDELVRRQAFAQRPPNAAPGQGPPPFLPPEQGFHPKRNQARQKLSSLGQPRFRELASDVCTELERRFPQFTGAEIPRTDSPASIRPGSRSQTPVNGAPNGLRSTSRMRKLSNASSIQGNGPVPYDSYGIPPSPGLPNDYGRPMPKQFQSNTIVPNKSTMVEEDDDAVVEDEDDPRNGFGMQRQRTRSNSASKTSRVTDRSAVASETDKKLIEDYQSQVRELREKLDQMEDVMKKKDDEMNGILDGERSRATAANLEKKEWSDLRIRLESKLAEAEDLNANLRQELDRQRSDNANDMRELRETMERQMADQMERLQMDAGSQKVSPELQRENEELRVELRRQQDVTEEVRRDAEGLLREIRLISQQSGTNWERQSELEKTIEQLEQEAKDWRDRYARTKTKLRNLRASSVGLTIDVDAARCIRDKGFTADNGLVKDVHVTKFQIAIDELLLRARKDDPEKVIESMKAVVVGVRRITKDVDQRPPKDDELAQKQAMLKGQVSSTANNLITASRNFAASAGISPVSLLDASASHLVAAIVEFLGTVKIRATPADELEDDDDGSITPIDSAGYFSQRSTQQDASPGPGPGPRMRDNGDKLPAPPPFQGLGALRSSAVSSAYSPESSPRQSTDVPYGGGRSPPRGNGVTMNGGGYMNTDKGLPAKPPPAFAPQQRDRRAEDLKIYLEDQTAVLVSDIQNLVGSIRGDATIDQLSSEIGSIAGVVSRVIDETQASGNADMVVRLADCRDRLLEAGDRGQNLAKKGLGPTNREWRMWTSTLPPIAFEIARETKALVQRVDQLVIGSGDDDFA